MLLSVDHQGFIPFFKCLGQFHFRILDAAEVIPDLLQECLGQCVGGGGLINYAAALPTEAQCDQLIGAACLPGKKRSQAGRRAAKDLGQPEGLLTCISSPEDGQLVTLALV